MCICAMQVPARLDGVVPEDFISVAKKQFVIVVGFLIITTQEWNLLYHLAGEVIKEADHRIIEPILLH